jgi:hypothetical protein
VVSAIALAVKIGLGNGTYVAGDHAGIEMLVRDVGRHPVLVGLYSRDGWNHPGPAMFYALALPYRLMGAHWIGIQLGALALNAAAVVGMVLIARRHGGRPLMLLTVVAIALAMHGVGAGFLRDPWNPYLPVMPFALLVFLTWAMTCGDAWALPVAVVVASFCVQTHVGYAALALPLLVFGAAWLVLGAVRKRRAGDDERSPRATTRSVLRAGIVALVALVVIWAPPIIDQFGDGNLSEVREYFNDPGEAAHTPLDAYRVFASEFGLTPHWVTGDASLAPLDAERTTLDAFVPIVLAAFAVALVAFRRWRATVAFRLAVTVGVAIVVGVASIARTLGPVYRYRLAWTVVLGAIAFSVALWAGWMFVVRRRPGTAPRWLAGAATALIVVLTVVNVADAARAHPLQEIETETLRDLVPPVLDALPPRTGQVVLEVRRSTERERCPGCDSTAHYSTGLFLALEKRGIDVGYRGTAGLIGSIEHRRYAGGPVRARLVIAHDDHFDELRRDPSLRLVAYSGDTPARERLRIMDEVRVLDAAHERGEIDDLVYFDRRVKLTGPLGDAIGVFLVVDGE